MYGLLYRPWVYILIHGGQTTNCHMQRNNHATFNTTITQSCNTTITQPCNATITQPCNAAIRSRNLATQQSRNLATQQSRNLATQKLFSLVRSMHTWLWYNFWYLWSGHCDYIIVQWANFQVWEGGLSNTKYFRERTVNEIMLKIIRKTTLPIFMGPLGTSRKSDIN
jgi:hypothetical protein